ncbi:MAG: glycosyltransferase family 2 protein [Lactobacillales bacterium]|jgi:glycosyltransferase involved in cell wall biosynthesis|nr:glycosyltransferase family 2 protein [Lactobacillales bacterium]
MSESNIELTILMPCLNESETLAICIKKATAYLAENNIAGEVLVADNGSDDGSQEIARLNGARVIDVPIRGYGAALIAGSNAALGTYVIMGDADDSYDFSNLNPFVEKLREGYELVMGNRFKGGIEKGAMPPLHRYLGNPVLSFVGRVLFKIPIGDFHCGLRGYNKESMQKLNLHTTGMEYASEMVVAASIHGLKFTEVPTALKKDGRTRAPHLNTWNDGWRHLKFLLAYAPNWLYLIPAAVLALIGVFAFASSFFDIAIEDSYKINSLIYGAFFIVLAVTVTEFWTIAKLYGVSSGLFCVKNKFIEKISNKDNTFIFVGALAFLASLIALVSQFIEWGKGGFSELNMYNSVLYTITASLVLAVSLQSVLFGFVLYILRQSTKRQ